MLPDALFQGDFLHLQCHCCDPQHHGFQSVALHPKARNGWGRGESLAVCHDPWQRMKAVDFLQSKAYHNPTSATHQDSTSIGVVCVHGRAACVKSFTDVDVQLFRLRPLGPSKRHFSAK